MICANVTKPEDKCPCGERARHVVYDAPAKTIQDVPVHCRACCPNAERSYTPLTAELKPYTDYVSEWNNVKVPFTPISAEALAEFEKDRRI